MTAAIFLRRPKLRDGVAVEESVEGFAVRLRGNTCRIEANEAARAPLRMLFGKLAESVKHDAIDHLFGDFAEEAHAVVDQLDRFGYLTEGGGFTLGAGVVKCDAFWRALRQVADADGIAAPRSFTQRLTENSATRAQLVSYAVEYLHIVRHGPGLVAPALNWVSDPSLRSKLSNFLAEEWRHDRLLAQSLAAVGIRAEDLRPATMLPQTFALLAQLGVRATIDPLALAALLFVYERANPEFHRLYVANCERTELPAAFIAPIVRHANMNDEGRHDDVAAALAAFACPVSRERALAALCDASVAVEHLRSLDLALASFD